MKPGILIGAAGLLAFAGLGCSGSGGQGKADVKPQVVVVQESEVVVVQTTPPSPPTQPVPPKAPVAPAAPQAPEKPEAPKSATKELVTGVRVNPAEGFVEFDAVVPMDVHDPRKPRIYLELIACPPDTKEHETVVMTKVKPSHVHAALLLIGLEPGTPGIWNWEGETLKAIPPTGPRVKVTAYVNGSQEPVDPAVWVLNVNTNKTLRESAEGNGWVFAGSKIFKRQGQDYYLADGDGTLIGLTTFGGETVAWTGMYNPDSGIEEPHWIANPATVPDYNTPVVIRISKE